MRQPRINGRRAVVVVVVVVTNEPLVSASHKPHRETTPGNDMQRIQLGTELDALPLSSPRDRPRRVFKRPRRVSGKGTAIYFPLQPNNCCKAA